MRDEIEDPRPTDEDRQEKKECDSRDVKASAELVGCVSRQKQDPNDDERQLRPQDRCAFGKRDAT